MKIERAAVLGATGYVGSNIVAELLSRGYQVRCGTRSPASSEWLKALGKDVSLFQLNYAEDNQGLLSEGLETHLEGCSSVFFAVGYEKQDPSTITFMCNSALATLDAARKAGVEVVCVTSSGGSTNPPGHPNDTPKNELLHWSDPVFQQEKGRFSPAAKTLMEIKCLENVGRNQQNQIIPGKEDVAKSSPRLVIMNPNLILGPQLKPGDISGNSLPWMVRIIKGETMNQTIPNDSMSIIDVRDLAALHVQATQQESASGRYFGVNKSWPWEEILAALETVVDTYKKPPRFEGAAATPTQFDTTRRDSLGVTLRSLETTLGDLVAFFREKGAI